MDNLEKEKFLSLEETEQLCRLYIECKLSLLEEAELQYVLCLLPYSTSIIEETRTLMNISLACELERKERLNIKPKNKYNLYRKILIVAASIAIILCVGFPIYYHFKQESELYCQVFSNGQEVSKEKAMIIAEEELERIDKFFENINNIESEQQQKIESLQ